MSSAQGRGRFLETLRKAQENERALAVYAEAEDFQAYEVGYVEHCDSSGVVLKCLTPRGEPDGRRGLRLDDIHRIEEDNAYVRKLELLFQYRDSVFDKAFRDGPDGKQNLVAQLEHAQDKGTMVHIVDSNDCGPTGFVKEVGKDFVVLERIGSTGEPDGTTTVLFSSICTAHIGRRQEQVLEFLYRYNYELKNLLGGKE